MASSNVVDSTPLKSILRKGAKSILFGNYGVMLLLCRCYCCSSCIRLNVVCKPFLFCFLDGNKVLLHPPLVDVKAQN